MHKISKEKNAQIRNVPQRKQQSCITKVFHRTETPFWYLFNKSKQKPEPEISYSSVVKTVSFWDFKFSNGLNRRMWRWISSKTVLTFMFHRNPSFNIHFQIESDWNQASLLWKEIEKKKKIVFAMLMPFISRIFVYESGSFTHSSFVLTRTWSQPTTRSFRVYRLFRQTMRTCENRGALHEIF